MYEWVIFFLEKIGECMGSLSDSQWHVPTQTKSEKGEGSHQYWVLHEHLCTPTGVSSWWWWKDGAYQGQIQNFLKEGAPKLRTDRTSAPVGTGGYLRGMCPLRSGEKL